MRGPWLGPKKHPLKQCNNGISHPCHVREVFPNCNGVRFLRLYAPPGSADPLLLEYPTREVFETIYRLCIRAGTFVSLIDLTLISFLYQQFCAVPCHPTNPQPIMLATLHMPLDVASVLAAIIGGATWYYLPRGRKSLSLNSESRVEIVPTPTKCPRSNTTKKKKEDISQFKDMYYKLQNLEQFPEVLPEAHRLLRSILDENLLLARYKSASKRSILHIEHFDREKVEQFVAAEFQDCMDDYEAYINRRKAKGAREFFPTREDGIKWLKNLAPLNLIDGAWICRIHKITTPFFLRGVTKDAWQTYSEEMGDGDLDKNHVFLYQRLMDNIGANLPAADSPDFVDPKHGMDDAGVWKASTAQLLVSLFPNEFLPEILGFNLHFEQLTMGTLKCIKELPEFKIDPEYFTLHVSIDNCNSGHSAMALATVDRYLRIVRETGLMDADEAWRRIQAGFILSANIDSEETVSILERQVADMLQKKARVARKLHCTSRARIGQRSLSDWFASREDSNSSKSSNEEGWEREFLDALADAKPWVHRGNSGKSLLMRELAWKGRMFGAFTDNEVELVRTWIDSLETGDADTDKTYTAHVGDLEREKDVFAPSKMDAAVFHPAFPPQQPLANCEDYDHEFTSRAPLNFDRVQLEALLPIWFAHPCLLENTVNSPFRMAAPLTSQILRILRAESGYKPESDGVAGMDEQLFASTSPDVIAIGLAIAKKHDLPQPACIADVLNQPNADASGSIAFAYNMLSWAMRPQENCAFLVGLARAFLDLEVYVANSEDILPRKERDALQAMISRKTPAFEACLSVLQTDQDQDQLRKFVAGYEGGRAEIEKVLA